MLAILVSILGWRWREAQRAKELSLPPDPVSEEVVADTATAPPDDDRAAAPDRVRVHVELNSADTTALKTVRGIGSVFAQRIVKYRNLIGGFQSKEQLLDVYGITPERYEGIAGQVWVDPVAVEKESVRIAESEEGKSTNELIVEEDNSVSANEPPVAVADPPAKKTIRIDLNQADSLDLVSVKGIGAKTASNILKYRRLIFFFHSVDQLDDVYGMHPDNLAKIKEQVYVSVDDPALPRLKVNEMEVKELAAHYFLTYKKARLIVAYRDQHGAYSSIEDLKKLRGIPAEDWEKLGPYLDFE